MDLPSNFIIGKDQDGHGYDVFLAFQFHMLEVNVFFRFSFLSVLMILIFNFDINMISYDS